LKLLFQTVNIVKTRLNYSLAILGILPTFYDGRTSISRDVLNGLRDYFGSRILKTVVRVNSKLAEAPSANEPIHTYAPGSRGAKDYGNLADEILEKEQMLNRGDAPRLKFGAGKNAEEKQDTNNISESSGSSLDSSQIL